MRFPKLFKPKGVTERKHKITLRNNAIYFKFIRYNKTVKELMKEYSLSYKSIRNILEQGAKISIQNHKQKTA